MLTLPCRATWVHATCPWGVDVFMAKLLDSTRIPSLRVRLFASIRASVGEATNVDPAFGTGTAAHHTAECRSTAMEEIQESVGLVLYGGGRKPCVA